MSRESTGSLEQLQQAKQLMAAGNVDAARPLIDALEGVHDLPPDAHITWQLLKSRLFFTTADYAASRDLAEQVWQASQERSRPLQAVDACIVMAEALEWLDKYKASLEAIIRGEQLLATITGAPSAAVAQRQAALLHRRGRYSWKTGNYDQAMKVFQQSLAIRQELGKKYNIALSLQNIGTVHFELGDRDQAVAYTQQALRMFRELGNKHRIIHCLHNLSLFYTAKGDLEQALAYQQEHQALAEELGDKRAIARGLTAFAAKFRMKGEIDRALDYAQQALPILEELGAQRLISNALYALGDIYWQQGALEQAREMLEQGLAIQQELGTKREYSFLFGLILLSLDKGSRDQAQAYLQRLQHINEQRESKIISQTYRLAEALMLKTSPRIRDKARAQDLLQHVVETKVIGHALTVIAMLHLCELLLDEVKAYGDPAVFQEAQMLVQKLYTLAQDQHSDLLVVDVLILQAKLALVEGNLTAATQLLEQAKHIADEKGLELLRKKVSREIQYLEAQYDTWRDLIQRNASFKERLEQARLADYITAAKQAFSLEPPEPSS